MKPYYETELGKLYHGDCLEVMQELIDEGVKIDLILTDPPYGMNFQSNRRKEKHLKIENDNDLWWLDKYIDLANELLKNNSHFYNFTSWHKVDEFKKAIQNNFVIKNILVWKKNNTGMGDLKGQYAPQYELCIFSIKGNKRKLNGNRDSDIVEFKRTVNKLHPTQKPVDLIKYLCEKSTKQNELVLDCFSGSGTTALACEQLNRQWICIEKEKKYCDITVQRLEEQKCELEK